MGIRSSSLSSSESTRSGWHSVGAVPVLKPREVVALLEKLGFVQVRQRGCTGSIATRTVEERQSHFMLVAIFRLHFSARSLVTLASRRSSCSVASELLSDEE